ncbi:MULTISPECIES: hypothetical protein [unclassified Paraflavitalea]|uniref:hypothetical protein n=1 Tax=unclassified Paraflavitalea TaxID=2798305 RepID=UPI003D338293
MKSAMGYLNFNYAIILIIILCFPFCKTRSRSYGEPITLQRQNIKQFYKIAKIDSIGNVFVIYARKDSSVYKIVSTKSEENCERLLVGKSYPLLLNNLVQKTVDSHKVSRHAIPHLGGIMYYGAPIIFEPDSILDIYTALNLSGLCLK